MTAVGQAAAVLRLRADEVAGSRRSSSSSVSRSTSGGRRGSTYKGPFLTPPQKISERLPARALDVAAGDDVVLGDRDDGAPQLLGEARQARLVGASHLLLPGLGASWADPDSEQAKAMMRSYVIRRPGTPHDVASLTVFLASEHASWVTGQTYPLNGGFSFAL